MAVWPRKEKEGIGERERVQRTQWVYGTKDADTEKKEGKRCYQFFLLLTLSFAVIPLVLCFFLHSTISR